MRSLRDYPVVWYIAIALPLLGAGCIHLLPVVTAWIENTDPKYYPLLSSLITSLGTLGAVFVAYLALRLNYRSQANPLRVELYKKQLQVIESMTKQVELLNSGRGQIDGATAPTLNDLIENHRKQIVRAYELAVESRPFLPSAIGILYTIVVAAYGDDFSNQIRGRYDDQGPVELAECQETHDSTGAFTSACKELLGVESLSRGTLGLVNPTHNLPSAEELSKKLDAFVARNS